MRLLCFIKFVKDRKECKNYSKQFYSLPTSAKTLLTDFHTIPSLTKITFQILNNFARSYYSSRDVINLLSRSSNLTSLYYEIPCTYVDKIQNVY